MTAGAGATGARSWLAGRVSPKVLKRATIVLLSLAFLVAATLSGSGN